MIAYIKGKLVHKEPTYVVVDVGGLGYQVRVSFNTFSQIKELDTGQLFTYLYIKGDAHTLYGFASIEEKNWFLHLIDVNSVGPRTAIAILSSLSPSELQQAILNKQVAALESIKGIGVKAAQRITLELGDRLVKKGLTASGGAVHVHNRTQLHQEALAALMKLGVGKAVAEKALFDTLRMHPENLSLEALIKLALKA